MSSGNLYARIKAVEQVAESADPSLVTDQDATAGSEHGVDNPRLRAEISMTALYVQLEPILQAIATDPTGAALEELRPRPEDYAKVPLRWT